MAFDVLIGEVYCPKCEQSFEKGSRRFCPTDGTRLVYDADPTDAGRQGVFSHLLPQTRPDRARDEVLADIPKFVTTEPNLLTLDDGPSKQAEEPVFEIDDIQPEFATEPKFAKTLDMS